MQKNESFKSKHEKQVTLAGIRANKVYRVGTTRCKVAVDRLTAWRSCTEQ
jgi:hypothetical protein